jgi:hypothetical protein
MAGFIDSQLSSRPFVPESLFENQLWYAHVSNCFVTSAFGIIGGLLTAKALGRDISNASVRKYSDNNPGS